MKSKLTIQKFTPKVLHHYIEAFKIYHFIDDLDVLLLPKGIFEIVFQSHHCFQHNTDYSSGWKLRPRHFIGGLHNKSYNVNSGTKDNYCIVVEFKPNTAKYFISEKLNAFQNAVVDINDIWGKSARILSQKIDREKLDECKLEHIENFLLQQLITSKKSVIDTALHEITLANGFVKIKELSNNAALSLAQFRKRFNEEVGISPSQYSKIVRVNTALKMIEENTKSFTDLTYTLGYYDQSHFIKDFKNVVGLSPKTYQSLQA